MVVDEIHNRVQRQPRPGDDEAPLGAGDAGFLLVYAPGGAREHVCAALPECKAYDVRFDPIGATIIYSD